MEAPMAVRVGLIGGECTGKSLLATTLADSLPACVAAEELRTFVREHGRAPRRAEQAGLLLRQQRREDALAASCPYPFLVADPAPLMTAVYSLLYFDDDTLLVPAIALARGYGLVAWCDVDLPWVPDGAQRDGAEFRDAAHALIEAHVAPALAAAGVRVVRVAGPVEDRAAAVGRAWQPGGPAAPT
jgi:nicotinamide riboside kinase